MIYTDIMKNKVLAIPRSTLYIAHHQFYRFHWWGSTRCCFKTKKGTQCSKSGTEPIKLDTNHFSLKSGSHIYCCKTHLNQFNKLSDKGKKLKINQGLSFYNLHLHNDVICRSADSQFSPHRIHLSRNGEEIMYPAHISVNQ